MNDRLGDLGADMPSWAVDDGDNDVETGFTENIPSAPSAGAGAGTGISSWAVGKSNDDFNDFKSPSADVGADGGPPELNEEQNAKETAAQGIMDSFFRDITSIKDDIGEIENVTRRIGEINEESNMSTSEKKEQTLSLELRPLVDITNKRAKKTKNLLTLLKEENKKFKEDKTLNQSDVRVRENLCNTITRKFIDEMKLYQSSQQKFKTDIKKKAERQILTMKADATPEEVEAIMKSDGGRENLMQQQFLSGGVNDTIKQTYNKVASKYKDVIALEQSVAELHQMFLDFALLTEQQGELIDQIEFNVKSAADYVEEANESVFHAITYSKSIRKKQCCIIVIVIILVLVVLFSLRILP
uniref:t-SNARE coiled-coil homology domain-containing protein n=1 Tax=Chaetoceros debilis TaxID=122233 RepID=A0A7S3Q439_9STRA|mmetsp:Transcript_26715/g.40873  ORF Transcript_26715/g.40873 Transcript_26715/m.40873 type:complete len:357 (+) Transcript_26715:159-1229(+)|eukprot:CAMPEP_0194073658 /NCGR_PEP_ID=MMETSP0149-20130528/992_1 /TAXON_ID=122233 /ORGANISM="Chaetoceros debilis, Strain MM31A-1" /LENGTH=356 /DNA_ID=CAMNT_0038753697 /DNA_START=106 /DNA_END=1176 /DNA_ORIENTATION=+